METGYSVESAHPQPLTQTLVTPEHGTVNNQTVDVDIEKLVYGGDGLGRLPSGEVILIPWSVPGETVRVVPQPGRPLRGTITEILKPSPDRVNPSCAVFGECGGCQWQHIQAETQRNWKTRIVEESLQRIGKLPDVPVLPILGEDASAWAARNRAQWDVEMLNGQQVKLGYHAAQSTDIVEFEHCHILPDSLNQIALQIRSVLCQNPQLAQGLQRVEAVQNQQGQFQILLDSTNPISSQALAKVLVDNVSNLAGVSLRNTSKPFAPLAALAGQNFLEEQLGEHRFRISAGSFFQTNLSGANQLLHVLTQFLHPDAKSLLDLYAGVGVFALHFSRSMSKIRAIESAPSSIADAQENIRFNRTQNVKLLQGDARSRLIKLKENFDVAIVDPPRSGCHAEVLHWLSQHIQKQILYVSCNPSTLARDLNRLATLGWKVKQVQPIDMFPQTYHIECVAQLERAI